MKLRLRGGLPYVQADLMYRGRHCVFEHVLLDTGSSGTVFAADSVLQVGLAYEAEDAVHRIRGIGGTEFVFVKQVDNLAVGGLQVAGFGIEVGALDYGFALDGIIGVDFLLEVGAVIDLAQMSVYAGAVRPTSA